MTANEAKIAVITMFTTGWNNATLIDAENEKFTEPESDPWVRITIRNLPGGQSTMGKDGNRKYERKALVFIQVFTPVGTGTADADLLAQDAQTILESKRLSIQSWTGNATIREVGAEGKWYAINVETELNYEEIK